MTSETRTWAYLGWTSMRPKDRTDELRKAEKEGFEAGWNAAMRAAHAKLAKILELP